MKALVCDMQNAGKYGDVSLPLQTQHHFCCGRKAKNCVLCQHLNYSEICLILYILKTGEAYEFSNITAVSG